MPRFPPRGPAGNRSPASAVLSRHYDFLPPLPPHFVAFAWRYHGARIVRSSRIPRAAGRPGVVDPVSPAGNLAWRRQDLPSSWGTPLVRLPMFFDPGRTARSRPLQSSSVAPATETAEAPTMRTISRLNSMAFGLAIYASSSKLPIHDARLASGRWSGATGRAFHPQGSDERFQSCFLHLIPLSQACLAQFRLVPFWFIFWAGRQRGRLWEPPLHSVRRRATARGGRISCKGLRLDALCVFRRAAIGKTLHCAARRRRHKTPTGKRAASWGARSVEMGIIAGFLVGSVR